MEETRNKKCLFATKPKPNTCGQSNLICPTEERLIKKKLPAKDEESDFSFLNVYTAKSKKKGDGVLPEIQCLIP